MPQGEHHCPAVEESPAAVPPQVEHHCPSVEESAAVPSQGEHHCPAVEESAAMHSPTSVEDSTAVPCLALVGQWPAPTSLVVTDHSPATADHPSHMAVVALRRIYW